MKLNDLNERERAIVGDYFRYSFDWDFLDVVAGCISRIDYKTLEGEELEEEIYNEIDTALIYSKDEWTIAEHYAACPSTLDWERVIYDFMDDIKEVIELLKSDYLK